MSAARFFIGLVAALGVLFLVAILGAGQAAGQGGYGPITPTNVPSATVTGIVQTVDGNATRTVDVSTAWAWSFYSTNALASNQTLTVRLASPVTSQMVDLVVSVLANETDVPQPGLHSTNYSATATFAAGAWPTSQVVFWRESETSWATNGAWVLRYSGTSPDGQWELFDGAAVFYAALPAANAGPDGLYFTNLSSVAVSAATETTYETNVVPASVTISGTDYDPDYAGAFPGNYEATTWLGTNAAGAYMAWNTDTNAYILYAANASMIYQATLWPTEWVFIFEGGAESPTGVYSEGGDVITTNVGYVTVTPSTGLNAYLPSGNWYEASEGVYTSGVWTIAPGSIADHEMKVDSVVYYGLASASVDGTYLPQGDMAVATNALTDTVTPVDPVTNRLTVAFAGTISTNEFDSPLTNKTVTGAESWWFRWQTNQWLYLNRKIWTP